MLPITHSKKLLLLVVLSVSVILNLYFLSRQFLDQNTQTSFTPFTPRLTRPLEPPVLDSNTNENTVVLHYDNLEDQLISRIQKTATPSSVGLFLQDARTGAWLGINETDSFQPASLLKIPIAMGTMKKIDQGDLSLDSNLVLATEDLDSSAGPLYQKGPGYRLTIRETLELMITYSDNTAKNLLRRQLSLAELERVFVHVGIPNPYSSNSDRKVSPRGYTRLFKTLYFSTYLTPPSSERILELATDTQLESLISAGVPPEVQVSHKYGEREDGLSDCGIIYHPTKPYFLCIMTTGIDHGIAKILLADLSKQIYLFVNSK